MSDEEDDTAALLLLAQLPLEARLLFGTLSKRWARLSSLPAAWSVLRFSEVALLWRFGRVLVNLAPALAMTRTLLARAGGALSG